MKSLFGNGKSIVSILATLIFVLGIDVTGYALPVSQRTPQVRDAIVAAVPGVNNANNVTAAHLAAITYLDLSGPFGGRNISLKAGDLDGLTALTSLTLRKNGLTSLPSSIFDDLTTLTDLDLTANNLTALPAGIFDNLTTLTHLNLGNNDLTALPSNIFDNLTELTHLYIDHNDLTSIPAGIFDNLIELTHFSLHDNDLTALPTGIFDNLTKLLIFSLRENKINDVSELESLTSLTMLYIGHNPISDYGPLHRLKAAIAAIEDHPGLTLDITIPPETTNTAPVFTDGTSTTRTIAENTASGEHIGTAITGTDADNDTLTYTLSGTDAAAFEIDATTGQLKTKAVLDYETKAIYTVTVTVSDGSLTDTITVTLNITDVNELPASRGVCKVGDVLAPGQSCTYPGTDETFSVNNNGIGQFLLFTAGNNLNIQNTELTGVSYTLVAKKLANGSWEIEEVGDDTNQQPETPEVPEPPIVTEKPIESDYDHIEGPWLWMIAPGGDIDIDNLSEASEGVITEPKIAQNGVNEGDHFGELQWTNGRLLPTTVCGIFLCSSDNVINVVREIGLTNSRQLSSYSAYALINISSPRDQNDVLMGVGSDDSIKVWLNGSVVYKNDVTRRTTGIQNRFHVNLNAGNNLLFIKVCNHGALWSNNDWGMFFKLYLDAQDYTLSLPMGDGNSWQPVTPAEDTPDSTPNTRIAFEANTPAGYTRVTLSNTGKVWGVPTQYTFDPTYSGDSDPGTVAYMALAKLMGCSFADAEVERQSKVFIKTESLGRLNNFASETVCGKTSGTWLSPWPAARITHLRFFDETSLPNIKEAVYNVATGQIELPGVWQQLPNNPTNTAPVFTDGAPATRTIAENTAAGQHIGTAITATDADNDTLTYTLGGTDAASFGIDATTGQLKTKAALNYETKNTYTVTITVSDGSLTDTITVTINVTDINEKVEDDTNPQPDTVEQPGNIDGTPTITISTEASLTEATLHGSVVTLTLSGKKFARSIYDLRDAVSVSGITGVTIGKYGVQRVSDTTVTVEITFNGDFDADASLTLNIGPDAIVDYNEGFTVQLPVTAVEETIVASTETRLTEATLHGSVVTLTLSGRKFAWSIYDLRDAVSVSGITGVTIGKYGVQRVSDTTVTVEITFNGDFDADTTLTFNIGPDAIREYDGPAFTAQLPVPGGHDSITPSTEAPLTEATLNGSTVMLTLSGRIYASSGSIRRAVSVSGIPGVTIRPPEEDCLLFGLFVCDTTYFVRRVSDTEITVQLEFEGDIDRDGTLTFTVGADAIDGYNGPDLTAQVTVTAVEEENGLLANFPNPFNPETWIPYQLAKPAEVTITIYAINGQVVRRLALGHQAAGLYQNRSRAAYWDGRNAFGEPVASGVYFYNITAGDFTATRKMLVRK